MSRTDIDQINEDILKEINELKDRWGEPDKGIAFLMIAYFAAEMTADVRQRGMYLMSKNLDSIYKKGKKAWRKAHEELMTEFSMTMLTRKIKTSVWEENNKDVDAVRGVMEEEIQKTKENLE